MSTDIAPERRAHLALWHSQFHGDGADDCSTDITSPCFILALTRQVVDLEARLAEAERERLKLARNAIRVNEWIARAEHAEAETARLRAGVAALVDECSDSACIHLNTLWGSLRALLDGTP